MGTVDSSPQVYVQQFTVDSTPEVYGQHFNAAESSTSETEVTDHQIKQATLSALPNIRKEYKKLYSQYVEALLKPSDRASSKALAKVLQLTFGRISKHPSDKYLDDGVGRRVLPEILDGFATAADQKEKPVMKSGSSVVAKYVSVNFASYQQALQEGGGESKTDKKKNGSNNRDDHLGSKTQHVLYSNIRAIIQEGFVAKDTTALDGKYNFSHLSSHGLDITKIIVAGLKSTSIKTSTAISKASDDELRAMAADMVVQVAKSSLNSKDKLDDKGYGKNKNNNSRGSRGRSRGGN